LNAGGTSARAASAPSPQGAKGKIPSVDWWITSRCNLACDFCYGPVPGKDPVELRDKILEALAASSAPVVTFCGGEPLLVHNLDKFAATLAESGKSAVLNTNGELLRKRLDQGFRLAGFSVVGVSIEGSTPEIHRAMRGRKADLHETIEAARLVSKEPGVDLKLATVASRVNQYDLPTLAAVVRDLAPSVWRIYQYSRRGDQNFALLRHELPDDWFRDLVREAKDIAKPVETKESSEAETAGCLIVDPAGNVLQPTYESYRRLGNCLEEPLDLIWPRILDPSVIVKNKSWLGILRYPIADQRQL
jgi:MoaA/NifB/PqqE/SkfB family radical SAM enzyme